MMHGVNVELLTRRGTARKYRKQKNASHSSRNNAIYRKMLIIEMDEE